MVTTKYSQIQAKIVEYIVRHHVRKDELLPTEKKMAELFGASIITVRKAVSNLEQEKIIRREQGRGTFLQKELSDSPPENGELLYLNLIQYGNEDHMPVLFPWLESHKEAMRKLGWKISIFITDRKPDTAILKRLRGVKGIIATNEISEEWISTLRSLNIPVVIMGAINVPRKEIPLVAFDYEKMTEMLALKLLAEGGRRFALFPGGCDYAPAREMFHSLSRVLEAHGIPFSEEQVCYARRNGRSGSAIVDTMAFLKQHPDIDAFLVESQAFIPMMAALYGSTRCPLTGILSVRPRFMNFARNIYEAVFTEDIAEKSLDTLLKLIHGEKVPQRQKIAPEFSNTLEVVE